MPHPLILKKEENVYELCTLRDSGVRAFFTTKIYDMSVGSSQRKEAYKKMGIDPGALVCPSQVHGNTVFVAAGAHAGFSADALTTNRCSLALSILTADCLPVFLFDSSNRAIALVHAGWRGVQKKIIAKTIGRMKDEFQTDPAGLTAALGPALRSCCYEVGPEFKEYFPDFLDARDGRLYFDIVSAAEAQLIENGVSPSRIQDCRICTSCRNDEFFSYRRQGKSAGRSMSVMEIL